MPQQTLDLDAATALITAINTQASAEVGDYVAVYSPSEVTIHAPNEGANDEDRQRHKIRRKLAVLKEATPDMGEQEQLQIMIEQIPAGRTFLVPLPLAAITIADPA